MGRGSSILEFVSILQRRRAAFCVPFFVLLLTGVCLTLLQSKIYEGSVSLIIQTAGTIGLGGSETIQEILQSQISRYKEIGSSRDLIRDVIRRGGFTQSLDSFLTGLRVRQEKDSPVLKVTLRGRDPETIRNFLESYIDELASLSDRFAQENRNMVLKNLETQTVETQSNLQKIEGEMKAFQEEQKLISLPDEMGRVLEESKKFRQDLLQAEIEAKNLRSHLQNISGKLSVMRKSGGTIGAAYEALVVFHRELANMELEQMRLSATYVAGHPRLVEILERINFLKKRIKEETLRGIPGNVSGNEGTSRVNLEEKFRTENRLLQTSAKIAFLKQEIEKREREFLDLSGQKEKYTSLIRKQRAFEQSLEKLIERKNSIFLEKQVVKGSISCLSRPEEPTFPIKPNFRVFLFCTLVLAFICGLVMASLAEQMDTTVKSVEETRDLLNIPVIGVIPDLEGCRKEKRGAGNGLDPFLCTHLQPSGLEAESFRCLRTGILQSCKLRPFQTLLIISPTCGIGKSTVAANTAIVLAQAGHKVILVDCDFRRPSLDLAFRLDNSRGLTRLLTGMEFEDAIQETPVKGLRVLTSGPLPPNPSDILQNAGFQAVVNFLKSQADFVIFDSPPLKKITDTLILATKIDRVFFLAGIGKTEKKEVALSGNLLKGLNCEVSGLICNHSPPGDPGEYDFLFKKA